MSNSSQSNGRQSSSSSRSTRSGNPAVESAVTRLLVSIKQLLESLTQWSIQKVDEAHVSDVYVRLGNDFNAAVAAFGAFNIDMSELMSVPEDLRNVLEQCLAEDANPENLELYLPTVRQIITGLLQGLRNKQSTYRRIASSSDRQESRSSKSHRKQLSRSTVDSERDSTSRRSAASTSSRRRDTSSSQAADSEAPFVGGFSPQIAEAPSIQDFNDLPNPYDNRQPASSAYPTTRSPPPQPVSPPPPAPSVPANVKRYSLVDKPVSPPPSVIVVEPASPDPERNDNQQSQTNGFPPPPPPPPPESPPLDASQAPAMASSLAALKKSDALERRASKRFSTYNISKMTGAVGRDRLGRNNSNRRSLAVSSALTPGELAVLTEVDDDEESSPPAPLTREGSLRSRAATPDNRYVTPPVPPLPATPSRTPEPSSSPVPMSAYSNDSDIKRGSDSKMTVFLQLGREVKKALLEPGLSFSSLRMLFVDKFSYNPGQENFPAIYIRDPSSGVQYELEDMDEVKEKCLLSLNIEPLDQIKQHIDIQISTLSQDIKELRSSVAANRRHSHISNIVSSPIAESTPVPNRPTDRQFQTVARRLSRFVSSVNEPSTSSPAPFSPNHIMPQMTGQTLQAQMTGGSILSDYSSRVVGDLKTQFDEVQNLRRDLGIMRQLYTEFMKQTKESLGTLRTQTQSVKQLAIANVGGSRAFIDSGKQKLDVRTQNVLTDVEKLQDTVENLKDDVLKRHVMPKALQLKSVKNSMDNTASELESIKEHIKTIKPMWKKTWAEELQNIVEEQQFLTHQEEFLSDLLEDHKGVVEIYGHVEQVINLRSAGSGRRINGRGFKPPAPENSSQSLSNVMMEIRTASVDPEKRMKAIEASRKNRQKELASRGDEMLGELTDFVEGKKLKMTGGAEEAERVRQKRNDMTLKAMFTGSSAVEISPMGGENAI
ncbi:actin interacting protein 3-domain-containing protein [Lentinula aff. detonsa]|uniref:Actin interacting protein 3-domain-containing protein n=1 Tax=Lentinula aff. detonsa TaxID=2804958 RepID=A0AA38NRI3_9AGAR|nr:actin interacting protein 3-domain-containing protein [Lentinula aff. detonsa]